MEWKLPIVNVMWLHDILLGDLTPLKLPVKEKYLKMNLSDAQLQLDVSRSASLMGKHKTVHTSPLPPASLMVPPAVNGSELIIL